MKNGTKITPALLEEWRACWNAERIATAFKKHPKGVTVQRALKDTSVPAEDHLWLGCKYLWAVDESAARYFAVECALSVAHLAGDEDDQAIFAGLMNDVVQIEDLPLSERGAARGAARDAARGAALEATIKRLLEWLS